MNTPVLSVLGLVRTSCPCVYLIGWYLLLLLQSTQAVWSIGCLTVFSTLLVPRIKTGFPFSECSFTWNELLGLARWLPKWEKR